MSLNRRAAAHNKADQKKNQKDHKQNPRDLRGCAGDAA
jgi:hypothetical protein